MLLPERVTYTICDASKAVTACSEAACFYRVFCEWAHIRYHAGGSHSQDRLSARIKARSDDTILPTGALYVPYDARYKIRPAVCLLANVLSRAWLAWLNLFMLLFLRCLWLSRPTAFEAAAQPVVACKPWHACVSRSALSLLIPGRNLLPWCSLLTRCCLSSAGTNCFALMLLMCLWLMKRSYPDTDADAWARVK